MAQAGINSTDSGSVTTSSDKTILDDLGNLQTAWSNTDLSSTIPKLLTDSMQGIYGMPYQWMDTVDRRLGNGIDFGRKYAEKVVARMPLLYLTPGRPSFMGDFDSSYKTRTLDGLINKASDVLYDKFLDTSSGRYYNFQFKYDQYFSYVNPMLQVLAKLMNVEKYTVKLGKTTTQLENADWSKALSTDFSNYFSLASCVPFYLDSEVQVQDSFENDTTESWLESQVENIESQVKELDFLIGQSNGKNTDLSALSNDLVDGLKSGVDGGINKILGSSSSASGLLKKITGSMASIATGGRLIFPKIWSDGGLSRSYSCTIKLRTPDMDPLSIYLNIMVPFIHLLAFVAPQMTWNNINSYSAPFLVRAFYKSMFSIDMGIITNMSVSKGKEGAWTANGLPTEMDINLTIKDLYDAFCISGFSDSMGISESMHYIFSGGDSGDSVVNMIKNTSMMDYLSNLAGLNLNKPSIGRNIEIYTMLKANQITTYPQRALMKVEQALDNVLSGIYKPT